MSFGAPTDWEGFFPHELRPQVLQLIIDTWEVFEKPTEKILENQITADFCSVLEDAKDELGLPFRVVNEHVRTKRKGRIDINFLTGYREDTYFAFECKRIRVLSEKTKKVISGYSQYIGKDGMLCFLSQKYIGKFGCGGMIGYVMDGNIDVTIKELNTVMLKNKGKLALTTTEGLVSSDETLLHELLRETRHLADKTTQLTLYHLFLPFINS